MCCFLSSTSRRQHDAKIEATLTKKSFNSLAIPSTFSRPVESLSFFFFLQNMLEIHFTLLFEHVIQNTPDSFNIVFMFLQQLIIIIFFHRSVYFLYFLYLFSFVFVQCFTFTIEPIFLFASFFQTFCLPWLTPLFMILSTQQRYYTNLIIFGFISNLSVIQLSDLSKKHRSDKKLTALQPCVRC